MMEWNVGKKRHHEWRGFNALKLRLKISVVNRIMPVENRHSFILHPQPACHALFIRRLLLLYRRRMSQTLKAPA